MNNRFIPAAALLLGSHAAIAIEPYTTDAIVVTATRTAQTADETLAPVTVITRKQIERQQATSVQELLRGMPGISIANNGGAGKATSLFLRGTESDHVLVLIDGVKVGSATTGSIAFQHFPVEQIERIEIVRGPRASLYGSEAIGGVIQIFTRKGGGSLKPFFSIGGGSDQTYQTSAGLSGGGEKNWFNLSTTTIDTEGFNACKANLSGGCFTDEPDKDGYQNLSGSLRGGYRFDNGLALDANLLHATGDTEYDGSFANETESLQQVMGGTLRYPLADIWQLTLAAGRSKDEADNFKDGVFSSRFNTERSTFSWQNDLAIGADHLLTLGVDYQQDKIDSNTDFAVSSRDNKGLFTQYQGRFGSHDLQLSLRGDDNEQFDKKQTTGGAAWGYAFGSGLRLTASVGTAFKAPTFNELYFPGFGNAALKPEESENVELGFRGQHGWGGWSVNLFENRIEELIAYDATVFAPGNISEARIRGIENELSIKLSGWDLSTSITLLDPQHRGNDENRGNVLPRRAKQTIRIDAHHDFGLIRAGAILVAQGQRYDDIANSRELSGYSTIDLRGEYAINNGWRLQAGINNLLDKAYETAANYNQAGRTYSVTLRYQP